MWATDEVIDELRNINDELCDGSAGEAAVRLGKLLDELLAIRRQENAMEEDREPIAPGDYHYYGAPS